MFFIAVSAAVDLHFEESIFSASALHYRILSRLDWKTFNKTGLVGKEKDQTKKPPSRERHIFGNGRRSLFDVGKMFSDRQADRQRSLPDVGEMFSDRQTDKQRQTE